MIDFRTRIAIPDAVLFRDLEGEAVILETISGKYFGLNETGTRMWLLLQRHGEVATAYEKLLSEYQVNADRLQEDLFRFVELLASRRLVELRVS